MSNSTGSRTSGCVGNNSNLYLRVYDVSDGAARIWSPIVVGRRLEGVWHSGVFVFGFEYFYGGGIVKMRPETVEATFGLTPTKIHFIGTTAISRLDFEKYLVTIMPMFKKDCYDLINWNCNHFADHIVNYLTGRHIPQYISDLPSDVSKTIMGKLVLNFIKMIHGANPITVDDPKHPKQQLEVRERRKSAPAFSPTSRGGSQMPNFGDKSTTSMDRGRSLSTLEGSLARGRSVPQKRPNVSANYPSTFAASTTTKNDENIESSRINRRTVSFWDDRDIVLIPLQHETLADEVECPVSMSPKHKKLYEAEKQRMLDAVGAAPTRDRVNAPVRFSRANSTSDFKGGVMPTRSMKQIVVSNTGNSASGNYGRRDRRSKTEDGACLLSAGAKVAVK